MAYSANLEKILNEVRKKTSKDIIVDTTTTTTDLDIACSWGSLLVDSIAPLIRGRLYEVYGGLSSSKTTLVLSAIAQMQKRGKVCAYIDAELAYSKRYASALGVNTDELVLLQPECEEDALEAMIMLTKSGEFGLVALDSTSALVPKAELIGDDTDLADVKMGLKSRLLNKAIYQVNIAANRTNTVAIFISQTRDSLSMFGSSEVIGVGKGLGFFASTRIKTARIGKIEGTMENGEKGVIAIPVKVVTSKNKIIAPFQECEILVQFGKGISVQSEYIQVAQNIGLLNKDGRGLILGFETPLYPADTPLASSMPKLLEIFDQIENEEDPFYWIKKELELRVQEKMGQITEDDIEKELADKYKIKESELLWAQKYLDYAAKMSSSSKLIEANYAICKAYIYSPFDKEIVSKYKAITKRYENKASSIIDFVVEVPFYEMENEPLLKIDLQTGEILEKETVKEVDCE